MFILLMTIHSQSASVDLAHLSLLYMDIGLLYTFSNLVNIKNQTAMK